MRGIATADAPIVCFHKYQYFWRIHGLRSVAETSSFERRKSVLLQTALMKRSRAGRGDLDSICNYITYYFRKGRSDGFIFSCGRVNTPLRPTARMISDPYARSDSRANQIHRGDHMH